MGVVVRGTLAFADSSGAHALKKPPARSVVLPNPKKRIKSRRENLCDVIFSMMPVNATVGQGHFAKGDIRNLAYGMLRPYVQFPYPLLTFQ